MSDGGGGGGTSCGKLVKKIWEIGSERGKNGAKRKWTASSEEYKSNEN